VWDLWWPNCAEAAFHPRFGSPPPVIISPLIHTHPSSSVRCALGPTSQCGSYLEIHFWIWTRLEFEIGMQIFRVTKDQICFMGNILTNLMRLCVDHIHDEWQSYNRIEVSSGKDTLNSRCALAVVTTWFSSFVSKCIWNSVLFCGCSQCSIGAMFVKKREQGFAETFQWDCWKNQTF
jgi:hypothetical protein